MWSTGGLAGVMGTWLHARPPGLCVICSSYSFDPLASRLPSASVCNVLSSMSESAVPLLRAAPPRWHAASRAVHHQRGWVGGWVGGGHSDRYSQAQIKPTPIRAAGGRLSITAVCSCNKQTWTLPLRCGRDVITSSLRCYLLLKPISATTRSSHAWTVYGWVDTAAINRPGIITAGQPPELYTG